MKDSLAARWITRHLALTAALGITLLFTLRFLKMLPFSGFTRISNYETIMAMASVFIYNREPFSFPLGAIQGLTFPFHDGNVGNVGGIPLFSVAIKALGKLFTYFQAFDYWVSIEILSCFATAFFSWKILATVGVRRLSFLALGALFTSTSFLLLNRSEWMQVFCVASFPLFAAWIYGCLLTLQRGEFQFRQDALLCLVFPAAALVDNYTLVGILLGTGILVLMEGFEAFFGGQRSSHLRLSRLIGLMIGGLALSVFALFLVGMFPLPPVPFNFTSYDFGIGGRYHVADLFAPFIPYSSSSGTFAHSSLLARIGFPLTTERLGAGQYEGVGYIGTAALLLWLGLLAQKAIVGERSLPASAGRLKLRSPWQKVALASTFVFLVSLGYELHILGEPFPNFVGMPGAWLAERFSSLYNIRAPGRLVNLFSLFLILDAVRRSEKLRLPARALSSLVVVLAIVHLAEVFPYLRPLPAKPLLPLGSNFSESEIASIRKMAKGQQALLVGPGMISSDAKWINDAYCLSYYAGIPSNLYYIARVIPEHFHTVSDDISLVMSGNWDELSRRYGRILIAIPAAHAAQVRKRVENSYEEFKIGQASVWQKRADLKQQEHL